MNMHPKGQIGEVVGFNGGYTHSQTKRAIICGVSKTTVSIMVGEQRVTFNRNTWTERGSKGSRFAAYLVSEAALLRDQARYKFLARERDHRQAINKELGTLTYALTFAQTAEGYAALAAKLAELAEQARLAADDIHQLETASEEARRAVAA